MKTVYHMKYALTSGVEAIQITKQQSEWLDKKGYFSIPHHYNLLQERDIAYSKEEAENMFEELKIKKLQSLDKQTKKYLKMKFRIKKA